MFCYFALYYFSPLRPVLVLAGTVFFSCVVEGEKVMCSWRFRCTALVFSTFGRLGDTDRELGFICVR